MTAESPMETGVLQGPGASVLKSDILERLIAKFIDFLVMGAFFAFPTAVGPLAGTTYILISDGLRGGSLGKRLIGLKAVSLADPAEETDFKQSIIRNSVFGVLVAIYFLLGWIPYLGKILIFVSWAAVVGIEVALIYTDELGQRFGDRIAGTIVIKAGKL
ncbi:MAG: RDD family protein [Deltaproteobacteria bacterium]|nr:RDD family protein [Deltaproteobacteria bacterium]